MDTTEKEVGHKIIDQIFDSVEFSNKNVTEFTEFYKSWYNLIVLNDIKETQINSVT